MNECEADGRQIFQVRIYSVDDSMVWKYAFTEYKPAQQAVSSYFCDEEHGTTVSRGIIRVLDPNLRGWVCFRAFENPATVFADGLAESSTLWRYRFYGMGDQLLCEQFSPTAASEKTVTSAMAVLNAFYCSISCQEVNAPEGYFLMTEPIRVNRAFHLIMDPDEQAKEAARQEAAKLDLPTLFQDALRDDLKETNRVLQKRAELDELFGAGS